MAAHVMRYPPPRRWPARVAGLLATAALLGSGVAIAVMVIPGADEEEAAAPAAVAPEPTAEPKPQGLTKRQRVARRAAVSVLTENGFKPVRLSDWRADASLRVLVGRDAEGRHRGFFFVGNEFVGNDAADISGRVKVAAARRRSVTLAYSLYEVGDEACCPSGGEARVTFRREDGALVADKPIPPVTSRVATG